MYTNFTMFQLVSKPKKKHKPNNDMLHHLQHILYVQGGQACRQAQLIGRHQLHITRALLKRPKRRKSRKTKSHKEAINAPSERSSRMRKR
jgi:hypothetical protein